MKRNLSRQHQEGISLLEVLLSLSIIAIILIMATRYFFVASDNDRVNSTREEVGALIAAIHSWKGQNPQYSADLSISTLWTQGFLANSKNLVTSGGTARLFDPWGQEITLVGSSGGAVINANLPSYNDCLKLQSSYPDATCSSGSGTFSLSIR